MTTFQELVLVEVTAVFRRQKLLGDRALAQLDEAQLFQSLDSESNSVAVIVRHLHGNMRSRWTDFLSSDGEKPDRHRDEEFIEPGERTRARVMDWWESGWQYLFDALGALSPSDVEATVVIRQEPMSAVAAVLRQVDHYGQHVGQIIMQAKHLRGADWQTLSIPRGKSEEVNRRMAGKS